MKDGIRKGVEKGAENGNILLLAITHKFGEQYSGTGKFIGQKLG